MGGISIFDKGGLSTFPIDLRSSGTVNIRPSGDIDDYISFSTTTNRSLISATSTTGNPLCLGKDATNGHSLDADDVIFGDDIEVDGIIYADSSVLVGSSGTPLTLTYNGTKSLQVYTTCASTSGTSYEPQFFNNILTGAGQTGGRFRINMSTNVQLGSWANAFKVQAELNATGGATGLLAVGTFELALPTGAGTGTVTCLELEMTTPTSGFDGEDQYMPFILFNTTGDTVAAFNDYGALFTLDAGLDPATGNLVGTGYSTLRITFNQWATTRYIPLSSAEESFTTAYPIIATYGSGASGSAIAATSTAPTAASNVVSGIVTLTDTWASGEVNAVYGKATITPVSSSETHNAAGGHFELTLAGHGQAIGLTTGLMVKIDSDTDDLNTGAIIEMYPHDDADFSVVPFIAFADYQTESGVQTNVLLEVGHDPMGATCSSGNKVAKNLVCTADVTSSGGASAGGLRIVVNGTAYWLATYTE